MKNCLIWLFAAVMTLISISTIQAQNNTQPVRATGAAAHKGVGVLSAQERAERYAQQLHAMVNLSETQITEVAKIGETFETQMDALRQSDLASDEKRTRGLALSNERTTAAKKILTAEQIAAWDKWEADLKEKRDARIREYNAKNPNNPVGN
ncbi:MAG: hypothetical protein IPL35_13835 [Sphingobacteriales bacterium]|nr:hypothetical protein [Sphingobacteriales bacterium]